MSYSTTLTPPLGSAVMLSFDQHENAIAISNPEQDEDLVFLGRE